MPQEPTSAPSTPTPSLGARLESHPVDVNALLPLALSDPQRALTLARTVLSPAELPIGVVTALIGSPVFIWILHTTRAVRT